MAELIRVVKLKMKINANWMILLVLVWSEACIQQSYSQSTSVLSQSEGDTVTLSCSLSGITLPEWRGPPSLTTYTNQDDASGNINPAAPAAVRLQVANSNMDLILSNAVISDSGDYQCSYTGVGDHTITLTVSPATPAPTTAPTPEKYVCFWCKRLDKPWKCWLVFAILILVILLAISIIIGMIVEAIYPLWGLLNQNQRKLSICALLFGLGLFLFDLIGQRCAGNGERVDAEDIEHHPDVENRHRQEPAHGNHQRNERQVRPQPPPPIGSSTQNNHGTGADNSFSLTTLPPIRGTSRTNGPN